MVSAASEFKFTRVIIINDWIYQYIFFWKLVFSRNYNPRWFWTLNKAGLNQHKLNKYVKIPQIFFTILVRVSGLFAAACNRSLLKRFVHLFSHQREFLSNPSKKKKKKKKKTERKLNYVTRKGNIIYFMSRKLENAEKRHK